MVPPATGTMASLIWPAATDWLRMAALIDSRFVWSATVLAWQEAAAQDRP